jgi:hypothetical protein
MSSRRAKGDKLVGKTWVHVFEEDTDAGAVYRPDDGDIPLSRRPRERFKINADGSAQLYTPGPDDRVVEHPATWEHDGDALVIRTADGAEVRIGEHSAAHLIAKKSKPPPS